MERLNVDCIANILSLTSPEETCRLSLVSTTFYSASESDDVWGKFLPLDYEDIISGSSPPPPLFPSKKQLYMWLSDHPLIIDNGTRSFSVEKRNGKRCYMLGARDLGIAWGDTPRYWSWTSRSDSRFAEVAELLSVWWLEIRGKIKINLLSPNTTYTAFLVYKLSAQTQGFKHKRIDVSLGVQGETTTHKVCLDPHQRGLNVEDEERFHPKMRGDGWIEFELGNYLNHSNNYNCNGLIEVGIMELEISVLEVAVWKRGLIVQGIEIRPQTRPAS